MLEYHEIRGIWLCSATAAPDVTFLTHCACDSECAVPAGLRMGEAPGPAGEKSPVFSEAENVRNDATLCHISLMVVLCFLYMFSMFTFHMTLFNNVWFMEFRSKIWHVWHGHLHIRKVKEKGYVPRGSGADVMWYCTMWRNGFDLREVECFFVM